MENRGPENRGPFGSRYEDEDERRRDFERGWEARRYRGEAYAGGYYGGGRGDRRESHEREPREREWNRESTSWEQRGRGERTFMDRVTDEVRSWFGDEDAERRRRQDFREMYGRDGRDDPDRWGRDPSWTGEPRRVSRGDFMGREHEDDRGRWDRTDTSVVWTGVSGWMGRGPYTGQGPRGYQRSDDRIREAVCERLSQHGMLDARDVDIVVARGEVTLRGSVPSRWAKREAEDVSESVSGVQDVHNELRVTQPGASPSATYQSGASQSGFPSGTTQPGTTFGRGGQEGEQRGRVA